MRYAPIYVKLIRQAMISRAHISRRLAAGRAESRPGKSHTPISRMPLIVQAYHRISSTPVLSAIPLRGLPVSRHFRYMYRITAYCFIFASSRQLRAQDAMKVCDDSDAPMIFRSMRFRQMARSARTAAFRQASAGAQVAATNTFLSRIDDADFRACVIAPRQRPQLAFAISDGHLYYCRIQPQGCISSGLSLTNFLFAPMS